MSGDERDQFEDRYFENSEFHEQLLAMEDELIDAYLRGHLPSLQRQQFERHFLISPERREKLRFAQALVQFGRENSPSMPPMMHAASGFERVRRAALGAFDLRNAGLKIVLAGCLLGLSVVVVVVWRYQSQHFAFTAYPTAPRQGSARSTSFPPPSVTPAPQLPPPIARQNAENDAKPPVLPALSFVLTPLERESAEVDHVPVPTIPRLVELRMDLDADEYSTYVVTLQGDNVQTSRTLTSQRTPESKQIVVWSFRSDALPLGRYTLRLEGVARGGTLEPVSAYAIQIERTP
jgi:hypothetical protein